jgi:protein O-GlcNAc transferase
VHEALRAVVAHLNGGRHQEAVDALEAYLQESPSDPDALHLSGVARLGLSRAEEALEFVDRSLAISDDDAEVHNNRGLALRAMDQLPAAAAAARRAIELDPLRREFRNNLANALADQGLREEALEAYGAALECDPGYALAHLHKGRVERELGRLDDALASLRRATETGSARAEAWLALGQTLTEMGDQQAAGKALRRALMLAPDSGEIAESMADALHVAGKLQPAVAQYRRALGLDASRSGAWYSMGCALVSLNDLSSAFEALTHAAKLQPQRPEVHYQRGKVAFELGRADAASRCMQQVLELGGSPAAMPALLALATFAPGAPSAEPDDILSIRRAWAERAIGPVTATPKLPDARTGRLRIGYVSGFFARMQWMKPVWALVDAHDRNRVEVHLFSDATRGAVGSHFHEQPGDHFHETGSLDDDAVAALIREQEIDVLVDLNAFSKPSRLGIFAHHPARVGVTWFNNYATLATPGIDWSIGDAVVAPLEEDDAYAERIVRVDGTYLTFGVQYPVPDVVDPPVSESGHFTFGSLASLYKLTPDVLDAWAAILAQAPESRLLVRNAGLETRANRDAFAAEFAARGIPRERLTLEGPATHAEFLRTYDRIDAALDPFPYNGGTTTMEALWQGVPLLTFTGDRWASRISASILLAADLPQFVADDVDSHVRAAVELATDPDVAARLTTLRRGMRAKLAASPAMDATAFARQMEDVYARLAE